MVSPIPCSHISSVPVHFVQSQNSTCEPIDFEGLASGVFVRDQFESIGLRVTGVGDYTGRIYSDGTAGIVNFGNSPTQSMHIGEIEQPTTFLPPPPIVTGLTLAPPYRSFRPKQDGSPSEMHRDTTSGLYEAKSQGLGQNLLSKVECPTNLWNLCGDGKIACSPG